MKDNLNSNLWSSIEGPKFLDELSLDHIPEVLDAGWGPIREARRGTLRLSTGEVRIRVALPHHFPHDKPLFFLIPSDALGTIPHIEPDGYICYADDEDLLLDSSNPQGILQECLSLVRQVLEDGIAKTNAWDFVEEFEAYWAKEVPDAQLLRSYISPEQDVKEIYLLHKKSKKHPYPLGLIPSRKLPFTVAEAIQRQYSYSPALYVPFESNSLVHPPPFGEIWGCNELRALIRKFVSPKNQVRIREFGNKMGSSQHHVLFSLPRNDNAHAWFGVRFNTPKNHGPRNRHPLATNNDSFETTPIHIRRVDADFLIERGGGHVNLRSKNVLLIGCGSVGSVISEQLAKAGVGSLTLVDDDRLMPENTFRHALGQLGNGVSKVIAIQKDLLAKFPFIKVACQDAKIQDLIENNNGFFKGFDLVISAIGSPTIELLINKTIQSSAGNPPTIFAWLEPLGIGGHALLTNQGGNSGCFACLFKVQNSEALHNQASFAASGQRFTKRLSGCRTSFVPYGAIDATQTACLATRLAINSLRGRELENPILSWKGDASDFIAAGYHLSDRFNGNESALFNNRLKYKDPKCRICAEQIA